MQLRHRKTGRLIHAYYTNALSIIFHVQNRNGVTAGNLQLQWAQNTATAVDPKVLANSYLEAHK